MSGFDASALELRVTEILNRRPAVGLVVGVVRRGAAPLFCARGVADVTSRNPVDVDTVFRIASITKTFTAVAVMQLYEQGLVDLDAPANDYLRSFRLAPAKVGWRPATLRDLLTHTAGIPKLVRPSRALASGWFGESVPVDRPPPPLGEFYRGRLPVVAEPGTTFNYSDHSLAAVGQIVEDVGGQPLDRYLRAHVLDPLGMVDTDLLRPERLAARRATGHRLQRTGPQPVTDRTWVTSAASSLSSTPRDMTRYVAALLDGGRGEHGPVLQPETLALMFDPHYQPDPRIPGIGLAFFRADLGGHRAIEHQGILPGFNAQLYLAPDDGIGVLGFTNGARNAVVWLTEEMRQLLGDLIGAPADAIRTDVPHHPELWSELCGSYRPIAQRNDTMVWFLTGAGAEVSVRDGWLWLRALSPFPALYRGFPLHPDDETDPYAFRIDLSAFDYGTPRIVFARDGTTTRLHLAGLVPLSAERRPAPAHLTRRAAGAAAAGTVATALLTRRRRHRSAAAGEGAASGGVVPIDARVLGTTVRCAIPPEEPHPQEVAPCQPPQGNDRPRPVPTPSRSGVRSPRRRSSCSPT
jgi:CubicO group peptidase (beta-lactamase class C family)